MKNKILLYFFVLSVTIFIGIIEIITSFQYRFSVVFLIPIILSSFFLNNFLAVFIAIASTFFSFYSFFNSHEELKPFIIWNNSLSFIMYLIIIYLTNMLKKNITTEKENYLITKMNSSLKEELEQKELIIREIHHRVKNHYSSIYSIIEMSSQNKVEDILTSVKNRIIAYGLLYDKLSYSDKNNTRIILDIYIKDLIESVISSYKYMSQDILYTVKGQEIELDSKNVTLIGLIINELLTNSIKYSFKHIDKKIITVTLLKEKNNLQITYFDNGPEFNPFKINHENKHLGMYLIDNLTKQLNGNYEYNHKDGSEYTFVLPLIKN